MLKQGANWADAVEEEERAASASRDASVRNGNSAPLTSDWKEFTEPAGGRRVLNPLFQSENEGQGAGIRSPAVDRSQPHPSTVDAGELGDVKRGSSRQRLDLSHGFHQHIVRDRGSGAMRPGQISIERGGVLCVQGWRS